MISICLWIVTALYIAQSAIYFVSGNAPMGMVVAGYSIANVGLIWAAQ